MARTQLLLSAGFATTAALLALFARLFQEGLAAYFTTVLAALGCLALALLVYTDALIVPHPRAVLPSEKTYLSSTADGRGPVTRQLPCWFDKWAVESRLGGHGAGSVDPEVMTAGIEPAEVSMSVVVPAYNEEDRVLPALKEMVDYLDNNFERRGPKGYEIIIVNDGSRDRTVDIVLGFSKDEGLHDVIRVVNLAKNRGKGGAIAHGLRHVRGRYVVFADADGASRFSDLAKLQGACESVMRVFNRCLAIGSRAHMVGSEAVVKRSALRNFLMRSFHLVLSILTPAVTSRIGDTQCGFKLLSRSSLPDIVPYMKSEGWIFDIEMLILAESAPATPILHIEDGAFLGTSPGIRIIEVPIEWHEIPGSKLNVVKDSIKMLIGLVRLRASWMLGVYRRREA